MNQISIISSGKMSYQQKKRWKKLDRSDTEKMIASIINTMLYYKMAREKRKCNEVFSTARDNIQEEEEKHL